MAEASYYRFPLPHRGGSASAWRNASAWAAIYVPACQWTSQTRMQTGLASLSGAREEAKFPIREQTGCH